MLWVFPEIVIPLLIAFLLGLLFGWLWWGWRRTKISYTEWETMRQRAGHSLSAEAEAELAELRAENERLQREIDEHECAVTTGIEGVLADADPEIQGLVAAAPAGDDGDDTAGDDGDDTAGDDGDDTADDAADDSAAGERAVTGDERHPFGDGSHAPYADDKRAMPEGYPIKGNVDSMLYHRPDSRNYGATIAEVWFATAEAAEANGFTLSPTHPKA